MVPAGNYSSAKHGRIMPTRIDAEQGIAASKRVEASAIATLWLVLYFLALGLAILSPSISRVIEFAVLTD
jgi:hypothetical protein